jgi:hypothetical protein
MAEERQPSEVVRVGGYSLNGLTIVCSVILILGLVVLVPVTSLLEFLLVEQHQITRGEFRGFKIGMSKLMCFGRSES